MADGQKPIMPNNPNEPAAPERVQVDDHAGARAAAHENAAHTAHTTPAENAERAAHEAVDAAGNTAGDGAGNAGTDADERRAMQQAREAENDNEQNDDESESRFKHIDFDNLSPDELKDLMDGLSSSKGSRRRNIWIILAVMLGIYLAYSAYNALVAVPVDTLTTNQFIAAVNEDRVEKVVYKTQDSSVSGAYTPSVDDTSQVALGDSQPANKPRQFKSYYIGHDSLQELMSKHPKVPFSIDTSTDSLLNTLVGSVIPMVLGIGVMIFFINQIMSQNGKAMSFGKAKARVGLKSKPKVRFKDVAGIDEAVEELKEVRDFLKDPKRYRKLGAKIPRGVLLVGAPGTGKTLLAKAVAGEAGVPFFSISGSDFVEMFVGVGASRVRDLFKQAKHAAPAIVFIDEIDAVGRQRGTGVGGGHDEREQTLNQLLVEMDGFEENDAVILIAATNRPDILDPALLRPGRFDRRVQVSSPDVVGRETILKVHAANKPLSPSVDLKYVAKLTPGLTGADLANLLNEAALLCARRNKTIIGMDEIEEALERVIAGPEKKGRILTKRERRTIAFHEGGHALVGHILNNADPVHKITIISRGSALGYTLQIPDQDKVLETKGEMLDQLAVMLGGRTSEELFCGDITTGASNDLEKATKLARNMVMRYGMSDDLGAQVYGEAQHEVFLGRDYASSSNYSQQTSQRIDDEVERLMREAHQRAFDVLKPREEHMKTIVKVLLERETVDGEAVSALLDNTWDEFVATHPEFASHADGAKTPNEGASSDADAAQADAANEDAANANAPKGDAPAN